MKTILQLFVLLLLTSGCYTKKEAIRKFCKPDTIQVALTIHDTIITERVQVDTIFNESVDTITIVKDNLIIQYRRAAGKVQLSGTIKADTIYREKKILVPVKVDCEDCKQSLFNKVLIMLGIVFLIIVCIFLMVKVF